jgi:Ca-activated chloride channel family protein
VCSILFFCIWVTTQEAQIQANETQGALQALNKNGKELGLCPLKHTDVHAAVSGFIARVNVRQEFENNFKEKIEAVYTFPLPQNAAVDDMTMHVGNRTVKGKILRREDAQIVYESAKEQGYVASLLDQERPNIFTQSVANIMPGEKVTVEISYVETLKYEEGFYEFVFPMVVGPRYMPASMSGSRDASRIPSQSPPKGVRAGHDISIEVKVDAGVPVESFVSPSHQIEKATMSASNSIIKLKNQSVIPNKDFILRYDVAGKKINDAVLTHGNGKSGFFTMILQPPDRVTFEDVMPKELVFVLDTSGSMEGFPIEKAKECMRLALDNLYPQDTFNLITFAGDTRILFDKPVAATNENLRKAKAFLAASTGYGGTEMMKAIKAALNPSDSQNHVRIVCFMTDGYVGNDMEIIAEIQRHANARVFSFGIGSSVNRFLLDKMAEEGRGEVEYVSLNDDGSAAAKRFHERVRNPLLTDIKIDWNGLPVADVYPERISDLFSAKPVILYGRYTAPASGTIRLKGMMSGREVVREIPVNFSENQSSHDVLATLWARTRVDDLMRPRYAGIQNDNADCNIQEMITQLGLEFRLMTQFTSFVAVEEMTITDGGVPRRIDVPIELPEGSFGDGMAEEKEDVDDEPPPPVAATNKKPNPTATTRTEMIARVDNSAKAPSKASSNASKVPPVPKKVSVVVGATNIDASAPSAPTLSPSPSNVPKIISGGVLNGKAVSLPKPAYPQVARAAKASGSVVVQVTVDESGNVISANVVSGHPLLTAAAANAASKSKFSPTMLSGKPVKVTGTIVYNFAGNGKAVSVSDKVGQNINAAQQTLSPEDQKRREILNKLHPAIYALIEKVKAKQIQATQNEIKFVINGKAEIQVWLKDKTPEAIEEIKQLGFEIILDPQFSKMVIGRVAIEKLKAISELKSVRYIAPQAK